MEDLTVIGRVIATENSPTTTTKVKFWVSENIQVRPFDIVRIDHLNKVKKGSSSNSSTYAMIIELEYITDGSGLLSSFISNDFGEVETIPRTLRVGTTIVSAEVLYNDAEIEMPIRDNQAVYWADAKGIKEALGLTGFNNPIPAGYISTSNGEEISIDLEGDFLIGPEGAHLNIAGISGLATKTSYAMFLMNALQQKCKNEISLVIFNVKGHDLLSIDEERSDISDKIKRDWTKCGLEPKPFENVKYFYPYCSDEKKNFTQSRVPEKILKRQISNGNAFNYYYDVESGLNKLGLLFSDIDDPQHTMESCAYATRDMKCANWGELIDNVKSETKAGRSKGKEISVQSWRKFYRLLVTRTANELFEEKSQTKKTAKRQRSSEEILKTLSAGKVCVIDIEPLPDYLQYLIVGDVIDLILSAKLGENEEIEPLDLGRVVVFADELNKFAPRSGTGTLSKILLEITERGRSLGTVLFGAEQFRSGVHDRVLGNCSTSVFGRTNPIEIRKGPEYQHLSPPQKSSLIRLPKGTLMLQHPLFTATAIKAQFPEPIYQQPKG